VLIKERQLMNYVDGLSESPPGDAIVGEAYMMQVKDKWVSYLYAP
jgi:hypothetical protein